MELAVSNKFSYCLALLFFGFVLHPLKTYSAETPVLERTITISIKQERIDQALKKISEAGGFVFSYNPSILDGSKIVSIDFINTPIREVLDNLFDGNMEYKERRKYIILTKPKKKTTTVVSGYITDENTGDKLRNVTIYDPKSLSSTVTDNYGFFSIKISKPTQDLSLAIKRTNYADTVVAVHSRKGLLKVSLKKSKERISIVTDSVKVKWQRFWKKLILQPDKFNMVNVDDTIYRARQFSILPFVGTNHKLSGHVINDYSFNLFGGYSLGNRKIEMAGTFNIERGDVKGVQFAGGFNGVYGKSKGLQFAGLINANYDSARNTQLAGLINLNWNAANSFSTAGLLNVVRHQSKGLMLAGLGNATLGSQRGAHIAGLFNFSTENSGLLQLAGLLNFTLGNMNGIQSSGLLNFVKDTVTGAQISGLINYATHVNGVQIGFINVSKDIKGVPIGFLSFVAKGYHQIEVSSDEIFYTNLSFRTGVRQFYNIFTAGIKPQNSKQNYWTFGYGVGTAPRFTKWLSLNVDITSNQVSDGDFTQAVNILNKVYVGFELRPIKKVAFTFGVTLNGYVTDNTYDQYSKLFTDYNPNIFYNHTYSNDMNMKMWLGGKVGLRFL